MMNALRLGVLALAAIMPFGVAHAQGMESSGSVTITVNIPPFAAGLAARAEGAVGLWTMTTESQSSLMVKLPESIQNGQNQVEAAIFTPASVPFRLFTADRNLQIGQSATTANNGLVRHGFTLMNSGVSPSVGNLPDPTATLVIAGV